MKRKMALALAGLLVVGTALSGCGSSGGSSDGEKTDSSGKSDVKFYGKVIEYTSGPLMCDALEEQLGDKYNFEMLQVDWGNLDKVIRTGIASNEPCDVYNVVSSNLANFKDQVVDLTPYLDENDGEWRKCFDPAALEMCTIDGKVLAIPWEVNFQTILGNKEAFDAAGVEIPESWDYETFMDACAKLKEAGYYPFATPMDLAQGAWLFGNGMLSAAVNAGTYEQYIAGELPFTGEETTQTLTAIKDLYDADYVYPGEGAVIAKKDEIQAAFSQGKVAMIANVAAGAKEVEGSASFEVVTVPWPSVGERPAYEGVSNAFLIPQNAANIEGAIEAIKAFTSAEIQGIHAEAGYIPVNTEVEITDPFVQGLAAQAKATYGYSFPQTAEYRDYTVNNLMPDLILNGGVELVETNLETLRQDYLSSQE
jgi:ABC-type glycerol-3-phosphate transport system substrate-binding protein